MQKILVLSSQSIAFARIKPENNSGDLINEIRQIGYSLYQKIKQLTKIIYNDMMKSLKYS